MKRLSAMTLCAVLCMTGGCAAPPPPVLAGALQPPSTQAPARVVPAEGVQIYECRARKDGAGYEWAFVAPEATLYGALRRAIGRHGAGPYWEARDGSRVEGKVVARSDAPAQDAVPWLLLSTQSTGARGEFSAITSIQRVNTTGGVAPDAGCNADAVGRHARVPYTADYVLFRER